MSKLHAPELPLISIESEKPVGSLSKVKLTSATKLPNATGLSLIHI